MATLISFLPMAIMNTPFLNTIDEILIGRNTYERALESGLQYY